MAKQVLCIVPRRAPPQFLRRLLPFYELEDARSVSAVRQGTRTAACDLYVIQTPLGWTDAALLCGDIRKHDTQTPIIIYALEAVPRERRELLAAGAQAYVARSDDPHNLHGTAGQLVMLAELRSMEAMRVGEKTMREGILRRLSAITRHANGQTESVIAEAQRTLKRDASRVFTSAGGTPAHFERLWPAIYESALGDFSRDQVELRTR